PGNFDAVIYDLTMHPEAFTILDKAEFLRNLFTKIRKNLRPDGIISLQCCSALDTHFFDLTKEILEEFFTDVAFEKIYVPSYCEPWIFGSARNRR
ncbi:MAG: spermine synthase, partial [Deltaproteobacteria bacterium]